MISHMVVLICGGFNSMVLRWLWPPWLGCSGRFVCQSPISGHSEFSFGRGAISSSFWVAAVAGEDRVCWGLFGVADGGDGLLSTALSFFVVHCRTSDPAAGLYIWEKPARPNGEAELR